MSIATTTYQLSQCAHPFDEDAIREHFAFLDPDGGLHLIVTPGDSPERKKARQKQARSKNVWHDGGMQKVSGKEYRKQFFGAVNRLIPTIQHATDVGDAVHAAINQTDGTGGRKESNIIRARFLFGDFDAKQGHFLPEVWALRPSRIIETSPGSFHAYWTIADEMELSTRDRLAKNLISILKCDRSVSDRSRVARVAGTWNLKSEPFLVRVVEGGSNRSYSTAELEAAIGKAPGLSISERAMGGQRRSYFDPDDPHDIEEQLRKLEACLSVIDPDCLGSDDTARYEACIRVGMICHHESDGDERGLTLWDT
jgi:hypothetical protein